MCILKMKRARRERGILRQRGLSLIETAAVMGVAAIAMGSFANIMADNTDQLKAKRVAEKVVEVQNAANDYVKANNADLLKATETNPFIVIPVGRESQDDEVPGGPPNTTLPSLQGGGFLTPSFIDRNGYNQRHAVIVRRTQIPTGEIRLESVVTTFGGQHVPDRQLQRIAAYVGASGGYVPSEPLPGDEDLVVGVQGGWRTPVETWGGDPSRRPGKGSVVATSAYEVGTTLNDYLYRNDIGIPEANTMNTDIDMNSHDLTRTNTIRGIGGTDTFGTPTNDVVTIGKDLKVGETVTAGIDIWAARDVKAQRIVDTDTNAQTPGKQYVVDASHVSEIYDLKARYIDLDTIVYGNSRGLTQGQGVRLGDLLPRVVPQNIKIATKDDPDVNFPECGAGEPMIVLSPIQDSQRFNVRLDVEYGSGVKDIEGSIKDGLEASYDTYVTDVRSTGRKTTIARQYHARPIPAQKKWIVEVTGTPQAENPSLNDDNKAYPWAMQATTSCKWS